MSALFLFMKKSFTIWYINVKIVLCVKNIGSVILHEKVSRWFRFHAGLCAGNYHCFD